MQNWCFFVASVTKRGHGWVQIPLRVDGNEKMRKLGLDEIVHGFYVFPVGHESFETRVKRGRPKVAAKNRLQRVGRNVLFHDVFELNKNNQNNVELAQKIGVGQHNV